MPKGDNSGRPQGTYSLMMSQKAKTRMARKPCGAMGAW